MHTTLTAVGYCQEYLHFIIFLAVVWVGTRKQDSNKYTFYIRKINVSEYCSSGVLPF
jgi:hypothetical protein